LVAGIGCRVHCFSHQARRASNRRANKLGYGNAEVCPKGRVDRALASVIHGSTLPQWGLNKQHGDSINAVSPFASMTSETTDKTNTIVTVTPIAHIKLLELRDAETEGEQLGLRLEILSEPGEDFRYDLSFDFYTKAAFSDEVRTIDGLKIIIPAKDIDSFQDAVIDHSDTQGLLIRNPNKPKSAQIEGLVNDDDVSAEIEAIVVAEVNPMLASHGGFVTFAGHDKEGTAYFTMGGGCHGCSMSRQTMLEGVGTMVSEKIPAITKVRDLTDHSTGANPFYS